MVDLSATPIKGKVMRIISLDDCGTPVTGSSLVVVSRGFIQVQVEPQYEDGEQHRQRLADGTLCVNDDDDDELTNVMLTIDFCGVCPSISQVTNGARLLSESGPLTTGTGAAYAEGPITERWSLELWQLVTGRGACDASGQQRYVYWAWPHVRSGKVGSLTIANAALTMQIMAKTDAASPQWDDIVAPAWLGTNVVNEDEHMLWNITTEAPPAIPSDCGAVTLE